MKDINSLIDIWKFAKIIYLFVFFLYIVFAVIIVRQVKIMAKTLTGALENNFRIASLLHLVLAIGLFFLALIIL